MQYCKHTAIATNTLWNLIEAHSRYQEYAAGLDRVELVDKNTISLYTVIGEWRGGSSFR